MLGPIEVLDGGRPIPLGGPKQRALLAVLLLNANRVVPRSNLIEALWGGNPPATAETSVHVYVSRLRKLLPPGRVETRPPGYLLHVGSGELDLAAFERLAEEGRRALARGDATAADRLHEALALWRGPALAGVELAASAWGEAHRLDELRDAALEDRIEADLARGLDAELIGELEALVGRDPLRERLRGQLMLALYRAGRQAEALEEYRAAFRALRDDLGLEPGEALQRLHTAMLRHAAELELLAPAAAHSRAAIIFAVLGPSAEAAADPAAVRDLLQRAFETASSELREAGAAVERGLAGALLARFDADAGRALGAAVAVRERLSGVFGESLRPRIGIEIGDVLAGDALTGTPVATASRLAGAAEAGEILVGELAAEEAPDAFELRRRGRCYVLV